MSDTITATMARWAAPAARLELSSPRRLLAWSARIRAACMRGLSWEVIRLRWVSARAEGSWIWASVAADCSAVAVGVSAIWVEVGSTWAASGCGS